MRGSGIVVAGIVVILSALIAVAGCVGLSTLVEPSRRSVALVIDGDEGAALGLAPITWWRLDSRCVTAPDDESLAVTGSSNGIPLSGGRITIDIVDGRGTVTVLDNRGHELLSGSVDDFEWDPWAQFFDAEGDYRSEYGDGRFRLEGNCYY